jgi:hypothetical protein
MSHADDAELMAPVPINQELRVDKAKTATLVPLRPVVTYHQDMEGVDWALIRFLPPDTVLPMHCTTEEMRQTLAPELDTSGREVVVRYMYPRGLLNAEDNCNGSDYEDAWGRSACEGKVAMRTYEKEMKQEYMTNDGNYISGDTISLDKKMSIITSWFIYPPRSQVVNFILRGPDTELVDRNRNLKTLHGQD